MVTPDQVLLTRVGKLHQGIEKKQIPASVRRSALLRGIPGLDKSCEGNYQSPSPSPTSHLPNGKACQPFTLAAMKLTLIQFAQHWTTAPQASDQKRKRQQESEDEIRPLSVKKKSRGSLTAPKEGTSRVEAARCANKEIYPIEYWTKEGSWPKEYFELDDQTREYLNRDLEEESWLKKYWIPEMEHLLARKKSSSSLSRIRSQASSSTSDITTHSYQKPREEKSHGYMDARYGTLLATKGSFMDKDKEGLRKESKDLCRDLLEIDQNVPKISRFSDDVFESTCRRIQDRNEAKVIDKIARLIVPSAEDLADFGGSEHLEFLVESIDAGWNNSIPVTKTRPQPDYAVGFGRSAFTKEQLRRLQPFVGDLIDTSYFMGTWYMYFPFFTCEVKCGAAALDIADRQNAHSMTLAVRAVMELFRLVKREKELDRKILAFSISHDHRAVRIYGHYPVIDGKDITYYRHPIRTFDFTELDGKEKWTAYKFTKNVYDKWMPGHFERICSAINDIPLDVNFELSQSASFAQDSQTQASQQSVVSVAMLEEDNSPLGLVGSQDITPNTSFTDQPFKRPRKKRAADS